MTLTLNELNSLNQTWNYIHKMYLIKQITSKLLFVLAEIKKKAPVTEALKNYNTFIIIYLRHSDVL